MKTKDYVINQNLSIQDRGGSGLRLSVYLTILTIHLQSHQVSLDLLLFFEVTLKLSDEMFVAGGSTHSKSELLSLSNWQWDIVQPYVSVNIINRAKIVSYQKSFYAFGGFVNDNQLTESIMKFENKVWLKVGILYSKRADYSTFLRNGNVYLIGGKGKSYNDICSLEDIVNCERIESHYVEIERPVLYGFDIDGSCNERGYFNIKNDRVIVLLKSIRKRK